MLPRLFLLCVVVLISALSMSAGAGEAADLVVRNANVLTVDDRQPRAGAFAVKDGRFIAVGPEETVAAYLKPGVATLDLGGKTVVPGFIDAHAHPGPVYPEDSAWASVDCRPAHVRTMDDLVVALRTRAARTEPGQWILGSRYQDTKLGRQPTRWDLDRASTAHPIIISHASGHQSVCNSLALELAKLTDQVRDPSGGHFGRDDEGRLNGVLQETAAGLVRAAISGRPTPPPAEMMAAYREGFRRYLACGITSVGVAGASPGSARLLERVRTSEVPLRLNVMLSEGSINEAISRKAEGRLGNAEVRYGAVKLFHGGSVSAHTCWISKPYANRPGYFGVPPARSQEKLNALIAKVHDAGLQVCIHANGDRDIAMVLTAFEQALTAHPRPDHRHRIEHCSVLTDELLQRIKALGLVVVPHSYLWELGDTVEAFGEDRWDRIHATRALLDHGIPIAAHSDSPVSTADPLLQIQAMVTRRTAEGKVYGFSQRVSAEEALRAWTLGGAFASFEEDLKGSIAPGKLADFVILADDPTAVPPDQIKDIAREQSYIAGKLVWDRASSVGSK